MATEFAVPKNAREICEATLTSARSYNVEKSILTSEIKVIDRLLERGLELDEAYEELCSKLHEHPHALKVFFDLLLSTAAFWNPEANLEARKGRAKLVEVNRHIEEKAAELANLLTERTALQNHSGFSCKTHYHPVDVMHAAAAKHYRYQNSVKERLDSIGGQFDLKYWPSLSDCVQAIADDAARATPLPHDAVTEAGTAASRAGLADSFKAFFVALDESGSENYGFLPRAFELTDRSVASLLSCALDLGPNEIVDSTYVKRLRQRERARQA